MFSGVNDQFVVWIFAGLLLLPLTFALRNRLPVFPVPGERWFASAGASMLVLNGLIVANFLSIYVFLGLLRVETVFWLFPQLAYLMSVIVIFWISPVALLILTGWASVGRKHGFSSLSIRISMLNWAASGINVAVYFGLNATIQYE